MSFPTARRFPEAPKILWWIVLSVAVSFYILFIGRTAFPVHGEVYFTLFDDAMISMRYARHLAEGHGLVWNLGEPPVEGYSNFLWTVWMAALHRLPVAVARTSLAVMLSGAALLLALVWIVAATARTLTGVRRSWAGLFAVVLTAFSFPLVYWTLRGMEVGLLAFLAALGTLFAFRLEEERRPALLLGLGLCLGALALTRDDAVAITAILAAYAVVKAPDRRARILTAVVLLAALAIPKGLHTAYRWSFYGDVLPNTYYLKLGGSPFAERIGRGLLTFGSALTQHLFPLLAAGGLLLASLLRRGRERVLRDRVLLLAALFLVQAAYSIYVGGDAWEYMRMANRYVAVALPALALLAGLGLARLGEAGGPAPRALGLALGLGTLAGGLWNVAEKVSEGLATPRDLAWGGAFAVLGMILTGIFLHGRVPRAQLAWAFAVWALVNGKWSLQWVLDNAYEIPMNIQMTRVGLLIRDSTDPRARIAVTAAGSTPYFSERPTVDILGKCDSRIARLPRVRAFMPGHDKRDLDYSLGVLRPDIVAHYWRPRPDAARAFAAYGYERMANGLYVHRKSAQVRRGAVSRKFDLFDRGGVTIEASLPPRTRER